MRSLRERQVRPGDTDARLGWLLVVATIPAGVLGLALQDPLREAFASPTVAAAFIAVNGVMLLFAERLRRAAPEAERAGAGSDARIVQRVGFREAVAIGFAQALALIPGFSRSGASMAGGLLAGLTDEDAARFVFLLATPIIGGAAVLKLPELLGSQGDHVRRQALAGALAAAITAHLAVRFLLRFFGRTGSLRSVSTA